MASNFKSGGTDLDDVFLLRSDTIFDGYPAGYKLFACGYNVEGQLGDNSINTALNFVEVVNNNSQFPYNWKSIGCGNNTSNGIKTDGTLWSWGANDWGQLGLGHNTKKSTPVQVGSLTNWNLIDIGFTHSIAIKTDGTLWSWGHNIFGQLGHGDTVNKSSPVQVGSLTTWKLVSCGGYYTAAIKTDGTLWVWGYNLYGQLGDNTNTDKSSPVQTVAGGTNWKSVGCGDTHMAAIKTDGTLWVWGYNLYGQLGDNTNTDKSSPVQTVAAGTNWKSVSGGGYHTAAIKTDGTLWVWGHNLYGQLGDNTITHRSSPVQVGALTNWAIVNAGYDFTLIIKTDGTLWSWGANNVGQLGLGDATPKSSPLQVGSLTNWSVIDSDFSHTLAGQYGISDPQL